MLDFFNEPTEIPLPKEYGLDFNTGKLTGEIVEGSEAIKVWAYLALQTARYRYPIFSWEYGSELEELIGKAYSEKYTESLAKKMVEECLLVNENIESIRNFTCKKEGEKLTLVFEIITKYGEEEINV